MESTIYTVALPACSVGMALMMWFMAKGMHNKPIAEQPRVAVSVERSTLDGVTERQRALAEQIARATTAPRRS